LVTILIALDLLGEEVLANADAGVAHTVDEHIVARVVTADEEAIPECVAAFARSQCYARGAAPDFLEARRVLVLQNFLGENRDGLRRIGQRFGKLRRREAIAFVVRGRIRIGVPIRRQVRRGGRRRLRSRLLLLPFAGKPPQLVADPDLLRRRLRSRWARACNRRVDRHRRERRLLSLCAGNRARCHKAGHRHFQ
jgi:hypothetical protein